MSRTCKNCAEPIHKKFCPNCGQSTDTHPINAHFLWHDIQHGLLHYEKGIPYTLKQLFTRPGDAIRDYIEGKRINHFKPISLILILAGFYGFLYHYFHINLVTSFTKATSEEGSKWVNFTAINEWIGTHYSVLALIKTPLLALASLWAFRKFGYNYVQHFVINAFLTAQNLFIRLIFLPIVIIYNETPHFLRISLFSDIISNGFAIWAFWQFFTTMKPKEKASRIALSYVYIALLFGAFILSGSFIYVLFMKAKHNL